MLGAPVANLVGTVWGPHSPCVRAGACGEGQAPESAQGRRGGGGGDLAPAGASEGGAGGGAGAGPRVGIQAGGSRGVRVGQNQYFKILCPRNVVSFSLVLNSYITLKASSKKSPQRIIFSIDTIFEVYKR